MLLPRCPKDLRIWLFLFKFLLIFCWFSCKKLCSLLWSLWEAGCQKIPSQSQLTQRSAAFFVFEIVYLVFGVYIFECVYFALWSAASCCMRQRHRHMCQLSHSATLAYVPVCHSGTLAYIFVCLHLSHSGTLQLCHFGICVHYMPLCRSGIQQLNAFRNTAKSTFSEGSWYLPLHALLVLHSKSPFTKAAYPRFLLLNWDDSFNMQLVWQQNLLFHLIDRRGVVFVPNSSHSFITSMDSGQWTLDR